MSNLNRVTLIGRLGKDPEVRSFQNGGQVVNLRLATSKKWKSRDGEHKEQTEWHSVAIFDEHCGKVAERYLKKGSLVFVEGSLETRKWQDQSGQDRYSTEVVLRSFSCQIILMPNGDRDDRGDDDRGGYGERGSGRGQHQHREGSWDSAGGAGRTGQPAGGSYREQVRKQDLDDDIPF